MPNNIPNHKRNNCFLPDVFLGRTFKPIETTEQKLKLQHESNKRLLKIIKMLKAVIIDIIK